MGYEAQSTVVTPLRSYTISSWSVRESVWMMLPSSWLCTQSGLIMSPQSWAHTTRVTRIRPVARSTATSMPMATSVSSCL